MKITIQELQSLVYDYYEIYNYFNNMVVYGDPASPDVSIQQPYTPTLDMLQDNLNQYVQLKNFAVREITGLKLLNIIEFPAKLAVMDELIQLIKPRVKVTAEILEKIKAQVSAANNGKLPPSTTHVGNTNNDFIFRLYRAAVNLHHHFNEYHTTIKTVSKFMRENSVAPIAAPANHVFENKKNLILLAESKEFISRLDACKILDVSEDTVDRMIKKQELRSKKLPNRTVVVSSQDVLDFYNNLR